MMVEQPGYDALADLYAQTFPTAFSNPVEASVVAAFVAQVHSGGAGRRVIDVGCGTGHVAAHLAGAGLEVVGVDPSSGMLGHARRTYPDLEFVVGDATLAGLDLGDVAGVLARYSLIHVDPDGLPKVLNGWARRLPVGAVVLVAGQSADEPGWQEFDHVVARAWRWHPGALAAELARAGFEERWRTVSRPDGEHRFPEMHLCAVLGPRRRTEL